MLKASGIEKNYGPLRVLKGVDLSIGRGEMVSIVGSSGAGKSTLLHILGTLDTPDRGEVRFNDKRYDHLRGKELARFRNRHIGFVFQFHHLLPEFSALENTLLPCLIQGMTMKEATSRAESILTLVGLKERLIHKPGELSGGEQQRVAVARAMVLEPKVLLADEPTGNLDTRTAESVFDLLLELNRMKGITLVIVTHNLKLAQKMSRQIQLVEGKAVE